MITFYAIGVLVCLLIFIWLNNTRNPNLEEDDHSNNIPYYLAFLSWILIFIMLVITVQMVNQYFNGDE